MAEAVGAATAGGAVHPDIAAPAPPTSAVDRNPRRLVFTDIGTPVRDDTDPARSWWPVAGSRFRLPATGYQLQATGYQNVSRNPTWPVRVDATLVIWPKMGERMFSWGLLNCSQLNTLN